ncbi:hypothetical protein PX52LOC_07993 [Limnoglobus roseus]|uniref:Uncharacterized protein n=1 Tax=Limnoglobus roseus TaxID=2598579 RepID=A0A5C1ATD9_9BACT|nr:hypothetical protein PX52LOC_07993 [Limnoglobus roseus]
MTPLCGHRAGGISKAAHPMAESPGGAKMSAFRRGMRMRPYGGIFNHPDLWPLGCTSPAAVESEKSEAEAGGVATPPAMVGGELAPTKSYPTQGWSSRTRSSRSGPGRRHGAGRLKRRDPAPQRLPGRRRVVLPAQGHGQVTDENQPPYWPDRLRRPADADTPPVIRVLDRHGRRHDPVPPDRFRPRSPATRESVLRVRSHGRPVRRRRLHRLAAGRLRSGS